MGSQADLSKGSQPQKPVLFFDIDNCLYSRDAKIFDLVSDLIDDYFEKHLSLTREEAVKLHHQYHTDYGHSIEGLVQHHKIDPIEYNAQVDDALPLEDILKPDMQLRKLLEDVDTSKVRLWLLTNAYVTHAKRVIRILGVEDLFEGLTYCDYSQVPFICKPNKNMFLKAMKEAGVESVQDCYFVGMASINDECKKRFHVDTDAQMTLTGIASALRRQAGQRLTFWREGSRCLRKQHHSIRFKVWKNSEISFLNSLSLQPVSRLMIEARSGSGDLEQRSATDNHRNTE
ncbi:pyrimidine 5'-nucleotidase [Colletotrichum asianum]|uniref:Pyrimidine 5'-nucleotidase n=1 Tax=Colletotrichum asianum TaxID=702518 RepID=A0A8H3WBH2_9PEZI|nr:pyrimidine 5'-nucleotidase [Colletotrichum asianum]